MKRTVCAVAVIGLAAVSRGQATIELRGLIRALQEKEFIPKPVQTLPTDLQGHPKLPPKEGALPAPSATAASDRLLRIVRAGEVERDGDRVVLTGGFELLYRGYRILADSADGNLQTEIFEFAGNVKVIGDDAVIEGDRVHVDFPKRFFRTTDGEAELRPRIFDGFLRDELYVKAGQASGTRLHIHGIDCEATTCNLENPHFQIVARNAEVRTGRRLIFRDAKLVVLDRTLFRIPYLAVPLNQPNYRYLPEVGQSRAEGYFVKTRTAVDTAGSSDLDARLDFYTKLGAGIGGDYRYGPEGADRNRFSLYSVPQGPGTIEAEALHRQPIGNALLSLDGRLQRNNYLLAANSTTWSSRAILALPPRRSGSTRLTLNRTANEAAGFSSHQQTVGLSDTRQFGRSTRSSLELNWASNESRFLSGSGVTRDQLDVRFGASHDLQRATAELAYQRSIPIGDTSNFFSSSDRTPVISLKTDSRRLLGPRLAPLTFNSELSLGEYVDPIDREHVRRSSFDLNFTRPAGARSRSRLAVNGRFRQTFYSDDTAQFIAGLGLTYTYVLGRDTQINLRYNYLRPQGFTPLAIDRSGRTDLVAGDLSFRPLRTLRLGAQTGYDFLQADRSQVPWHQVGVRAEYTPWSFLNFRSLSTYDTVRQAWSNIRFDLGYRPGATFVALGARYDGIRHVWGNANLFVSGLKAGRFSVDARVAYNGFLKRFEAQQYGIVYDLHCAEFVLQVNEIGTGFRSGREIQFFIRLKALPFFSPFGVGPQGQPIGTGTGRDF